MRLLVRLQELLLRLAPRAFRERFGEEIRIVARRAVEDARVEGGGLAAFVLCVRQTIDVAASTLRLHIESPAMYTTLLLLPPALVAAALVGWVDTHAEEVQPAAGLLFFGAAIFSFLEPRRAWLWWLLLGLSVPCAHAIALAVGARLPYEVHSLAPTLLALLPAGFGALAGFLAGIAHRRRRLTPS